MKRILIIQTAFIGDVILASSLIEQAYLHFPDHKIDFLLRKGNENLLETNPHLENLWIWDKKKKYRSMFSIIKKLRRQKYQYVFNIQRFTNSSLFTLFSGAKNKIGFHSNILSYFFTHRVKHQIPYFTEDNLYLHEVQRNFLLLNQILNISMPDKKELKPKLYFSDDDFKVINQHREDSNYIVLAPSSVWFTKQWPMDKWIQLFLELKDYTCYFVGAPSDKNYIDKIIGLKSNGIDLSGKLSLRQSALLMRDATRVIVNDSAPLHLASSVNAKTTAIFCSTIPEFGYGPLSDQEKTIQLSPRLECMPCGLHGKDECPLGHFKCGIGIETKKVFQTIG